MEYGTAFRFAVNNIFSSDEVSIGISALGNGLSLENNNTFNRSLIVKVDGDEVEIPVIAREHFEGIISNGIWYSSVKKIKTIILPLYENSIPQNRRTFDSFMRQFFSTSYDNRLIKVTSNKGEVYYGGRGLIFDYRYNPLILCTLRAKRVLEEGNIHPQMVYYRPVIYVSPTVFEESDRLVNKGIIKKLIPYCVNRGIVFPSSRYGFRSIPEDNKAMVIVDKLDRFFIKPIAPKPQNDIEESLNECLVDNIEDILQMI